MNYTAQRFIAISLGILINTLLAAIPLGLLSLIPSDPIRYTLVGLLSFYLLLRNGPAMIIPLAIASMIVFL